MMTAIRDRAGAIACLLGVLALSNSARAEEREVPVKQKFVVRLQQAIRSNDKVWLADHVRYPLRYFGHSTKQIPGKASFLKHYPALIGEKLRAGILTQDPEQVFETYQGMMIGDGPINLWVRQRGDDGLSDVFDIITINDKE